MSNKIEIHRNKTLKLNNVLINNILQVSTLEDTEDNSINQDFSVEMEVAKMNNEIRTKGAQQIGPLIQYSGTEFRSEEDIKIKICLMMQADRFIKNISEPYKMEPLISVKNCMYTRFNGLESDINFAYQKIQVEAYENDIKLKGSSYTVFVDSNEETGEITADIFMEKE